MAERNYATGPIAGPPMPAEGAAPPPGALDAALVKRAMGAQLAQAVAQAGYTPEAFAEAIAMGAEMGLIPPEQAQQMQQVAQSPEAIKQVVDSMAAQRVTPG